MRRALCSLAGLALAATLIGCATPRQPEIQSQQDPDTDISAYETFGWMPAGDTDPPESLTDKHLRNAIREVLTGRGYRAAERDPQLLMTWEFLAAEKLESNPFSIGVGMGSWGGNVGGSVGMSTGGVRNVREGQLVIHAVDAAEKREIWLGSVTGTLDVRNPDAIASRQLVELALRDFPVRAGGTGRQ
jgi:hypothetical protein